MQRWGILKRSFRSVFHRRAQAATEHAAKTLGLEYQIEKVSDLNQIMSLGVMMTPALVVDGKVKVAGRVPSLEDIKKMLA